MDKSTKLVEVESKDKKNRNEKFHNWVLVISGIVVLAGAFLTALI